MHLCYISTEFLGILALILEDFLTTFKEQNDGKHIWPWTKAFCFVQECVLSLSTCSLLAAVGKINL